MQPAGWKLNRKELRIFNRNAKPADYFYTTDKKSGQTVAQPDGIFTRPLTMKKNITMVCDAGQKQTVKPSFTFG
jgi:hypothetical protein